LNKQFSYKVASETRTTTIIDALKLLRKNYTIFGFMDVIQTYINLLRQNVHLDDGLLSQLERLINEFKDLLNPWVAAQSIIGNAKERQLTLPVRLAEVLKTNCENKLRIITASENPSQNFMHQMVKKLCDYFQTRMDGMRRGFDINDEVHLGSALYLFLLHYDQLLLPILKQIMIANKTPDGKEMIKYKAVFVGGRRTRHKRSGHKRSGHKRSGHKKRIGKRSGKSGHKRSGNKKKCMSRRR
jgi:hypothetical protein